MAGRRISAAAVGLLCLAVVTQIRAQGTNNVPLFSPIPFIYQIPENAPAGAYIGVEDPITATDFEGDNITFSIPSGTINSDKFEIRSFENNTAVLVVRPGVLLDREVLTPNNAPLRVTVEASDGLEHDVDFETTTVQIFLQDVNDVVPRFTNLPETITILENINLGDEVYDVDAEDEDAGFNAFIRFSLLSGSTMFEIDESTGIISLIQSLDFDDVAGKVHIVDVMATDSGELPNSGVAVLEIRVEDVNDLGPVFVPDLSVFPVTVHENLTRGDTVYQVTAIDGDRGVDDNITYSIMAGNELLNGTYVFAIDNETGIISVNVEMLDRETPGHDEYTLTVEAMEVNDPSMTTTVRVEIDILDINDNSPFFEEPLYQGNVSELAPDGTRVLTVVAEDPDEGIHAMFDFSLEVVGNLTGPLPFSITNDEGTGYIVKSGNLDYETTQVYTFLAIARETIGNRLRNASTLVVIYVNNENDNSPVFGNQTYTASIAEEVGAGDFVQLITANDDDLGSPGIVRYRLIDGDMGRFNITEETGIVSTTEELDYEELSQYTITVEAYDLADPGEMRSSQALLLVNLENINDNIPEFFMDGMNISEVTVNITEELMAGVEVYEAQVIDADRDLNELTYEIISGNDLNTFALRPGEQNVLITTGQLDYDADPSQRQHDLIIEVDDSNFTSVLYITIEVIDINDNDPLFSRISYTFDIEEDTTNGTFVGNVSATDIDSSLFGYVEYSLSGQGAEVFTIDPYTGNIYTVGSLDRELVDMYELTATATDRDPDLLARRSSTVPVTITVLDRNDNDPMFEESFYQFEVTENADIVSLFVSATDRDTGVNADIFYDIIAGNLNDTFEIESSTGEIQRNPLKQIDRELLSQQGRSRYDLTIIARDGGYPQRNATATVQIDVLDVNDVIPQFPETSYTATIPETFSQGSIVDVLVAEDADTGANGRVRYSISVLTQGGESLFVIEETSGTVRSAGTFDREDFAGPYTIEVLAEDSGSPSLSGTTVLVVYIEDVNDEPPDFDLSSYSTQITESDEDPGVVFMPMFVIQVSASDSDEAGTPNSNLTYNITNVIPTDFEGSGVIGGVPPIEHFSINDTSGEIFTAIKLDYEIVRSYSIAVEAADMGMPQRSSTVFVSVDIEDINDNRPMPVPGLVFAFSVPEDASTNTRYTQVSAVDADSGVFGELTYTIESYSTVPPDFDLPFIMDPDSGDLVLESSLDYETVTLYSLAIRISDGGDPSESAGAFVFITVNDTNDHTPTFSMTSQDIDVAEGNYTNSPQAVSNLNAVDEDSGSLGNVTYAIISGNNNGIFALSVLDGILSVVGNLDRETRDEYTLTVLAQDGGDPSLSSTAEVIVSVLDVNDLRPVFSLSSYQGNVEEGLNAGESVLRVSAVDLDEGENGRVIYFIDNPIHLQNFEVNETTGWITTRRVFDYENEISFTFFVTARDNDSSIADRQSATVEVTVDIDDINDNPPIFDPITIPLPIILAENTAVNTVVTSVTARDRDSALNAQIEYQIANGEGRFSISSTGSITIASPLDRETTSSYNLTIIATDGTHIAMEYLPIIVSDINDVVPVFSQESYSRLVGEDTAVDSTVTTVVATDLDLGASGDITFTITGGDTGNQFRIERRRLNSTMWAGDIIVDRALDYEDTSAYVLTIEATDGALPDHSSSATVTITVLDVNDNPPTFSATEYTFQVPEGTPTTSAIGTVVATDSDGGLFGMLSYSFTASADAETNATFSIDASSGVITLTRSLDYEARREYAFDVQAQDGSSDPTPSTVPVTVEVQNTNEFAPVFNQPTYEASVIEQSPVAVLFVTQVNATERDGGSNIQYSIAAGDLGHFDIDTDTGVITTTVTLDREMISRYVLTVRATDTGDVSRNGFAQVDITVSDINDNMPRFSHTSFNYQLPENSDPGTPLSPVLTAVDIDDGVNAAVTYRVTGGPFTVDTTTGIIAVATGANLDRESDDTYELTLSAADGGEPVMASSVNIIVTLSDVNDNNPEFGTGPFEASVLENSPEGTPVRTIVATDRDINEITYSIDSGDDVLPKFRIQSSSGLIETTDNPLDRETRDTYTLMILATDDGNPQRSASVAVIVTVDDVNDNLPQFVGTPFNFPAFEANTFGVVVAEIEVSDGDIGTNAEVRFAITGGNSDDIFSINDISGELTIEPDLLDYETQDEHILRITATDQAANAAFRMTATAMVTVTVVDVNDNRPLFSESTYSASVQETASIGETVIVVRASDLDSGTNGDVTYRFQGSINAFSVNATSGAVTVSGVLDRESVRQYDLTVEGIDGGNPSLTGTAALIINIIDANDNSPQFDRSFYTAEIAENVMVGTEVHTVTAFDRDGTSPTYSIVGGNPGEYFRIQQLSGVVEVARELDREDIALSDITILATDEGGLNGSTILQVTILDVNDQAPVFTQAVYYAEVVENSPQGTQILPTVNGTTIGIEAFDADEPGTQNSRVLYQLEGVDADLFNIDFDTGIVTVARGAVLDREDRTMITVQVTARDSVLPPNDLSNTVDLHIEVTDLNDVAPIFTQPFGYAVAIAENTAPGSTITDNVIANDPDSNEGGEVEYSIIGSDPVGSQDSFVIAEDTGVIVLVDYLDREETTVVTLSVRAEDRGIPVRSSVVSVQVTVTDVNDNKPVFTEEEYIVLNVPEFTPTGASVAQVIANDPDVSFNGEVLYSIDRVDGPFTINENTGVVTTTNTLDYETRIFYNMSVKASDQGMPVMCASANVLIYVGDFNDEVPTFDLERYEADVFENYTSGRIVMQPIAYDRDSTINAQLTYSLEDETSGLFTLDSTNGQISLTRSIEDFDLGQEHTFTIVATDGGDPQRSGSAEVFIRVLNISAVPLYFDTSYYIFDVPENVQNSLLELTVTSTETPTYDFSPRYTGFDLASNFFRVTDPLDREERDLYTVVVSASAGGFTTYSTVTIIVADVNDNVPEFTPAVYSFAVEENAPAPEILGQVVATDRDAGDNARIIFSIDPRTDTEGVFNIDTSGVISTNASLDRESTGSYNLIIYADNPGPVHRQQASVSVTVLDVNDVIPRCSEALYSVEVTENVPIGSQVTTVQASDNDTGANAMLTFSIIGGDIGVFQIDDQSGEATTIAEIDYEITTSFQLRVQVADSGVPVRSSTCDIDIEVLDFNDCPPEFINPIDERTVNENMPIGSIIAEYSVLDCDSGLNGVNGTRFSIVAGNTDGHFSINEFSGLLTTTVVLDREARDSYLLSIQARDSAGVNSLSSITQIMITVADVNDNSPVFTSTMVDISINEGEDINEVILTVPATDRDADANSDIVYSLMGGQGVFVINSGTGGISLSQSLDRETVDNYTLTIIARDNGVDPQSSSATVAVTVEDDNDNAPTILNIISGVTIRNVSEGAGLGMEVYTVEAIDRDIGANGDILFSLDDTTMPFNISRSTGVITVTRSLDYEIQREYSVVVRAVDQGIVRQLTGVATLTIQVLDENDNAPVFQLPLYSANLNENTPSRAVVTVTALDADQTGTANAIVRYSIIDGDTSAFIIEPYDGTIYNNRTLDREVTEEYTLIVQASNSLSHNPLNATTTVVITVLDQNDEAPEFDRSSYGEVISELQAVGSMVLQVSATDNDQINTPNSEVAYTFSRLDNNPFHIDRNTGIITVQSTLDYEEEQFYQLMVTAEDKGVPSQTSVVTVNVTLIDENDVAPEFVLPAGQNTLTAEVGELEDSFPYLLARVDYVDPDSERNSASNVTIQAVRGENGDEIDNNLFLASTDASSSSGMIFLRDSVDHETQSFYTLTLAVTNFVEGVGELCDGQATCELKSTIDLEVTVTDENDNPPKFTEDNYVAEVSTTADPGTSVITVRAVDDDSGSFGEVQYSLAVNPGGLFQIDAENGIIFTRQSLENMDGFTVVLEVAAFDNAGVSPSMSANASVSVLLLNDFQRVRIVFETSLDVILGKEDFIVEALQNVSGLVIIVESVTVGEPSTRTNFTFHAIDPASNEIVDYYEFLASIEGMEDELFETLAACNILEIVPAAGPAVYPPALDTPTLVIIVLCGILVVGALLLFFLAFRQRYLALHDARSRLLADVFYGTPGTSDIENVPQQDIQMEPLKGPSQNPMFVHPYDNWAGVDTSGAESVGESMSLKRDNPLYESQEIRMEMFADVSDEDTEGEVDDAELLAAALKEDEDLEDNSVTAI